MLVCRISVVVAWSGAPPVGARMREGLPPRLPATAAFAAPLNAIAPASASVGSAAELPAAELPIQLETPFGPVAGTPAMFVLPVLSISTALGSLAFAALTDGKPAVLRGSGWSSSPFGPFKA